MSWREMRNFSEMMRTLGYPRLISIECFRNPNFPAVADILTWLALRFDPNADIPKCVDTEQDRVIFIKIVVKFFANKAFIKLSPKRLYKADGYAVKEMLKIVNLLSSALKADKGSGDNEYTDPNIAEIMSVERLKELQHTRYLASLLTSTGATLHSHMTREVDFRQARNEAINRQIDVEWVEKCLTGASGAIREEITKMETALANIKTDESALNQKIEKRQGELERNRKRLMTLQSVKPAYMEEYEQLEEELNIYYETYLTHFRNLSYLESLKEEFMNHDDGRVEEDELAIKSAVEELRKITDGVDHIYPSVDDAQGGDVVFTSKSRSTNSRKKSAILSTEFSNTKAEGVAGLGLSDDSETSDSENEGDEEEDEEEEEDGLNDSSASGSDSLTNGSNSELGQDHDDVIKGLSVIGTGYRMSESWTPEACNEFKVFRSKGASDDPISMALYNNSSVKGEITNEDMDRALAEAIAEANALTDDTDLRINENIRFGTNRSHVGSSKIMRISEERDEEIDG